MTITRPMAIRCRLRPRRPDGKASSRYADNALTRRRVANASPATAGTGVAWNSGMYQLYPIATRSGPVVLSGRRRHAMAPATRYAIPTTSAWTMAATAAPARSETRPARVAMIRPMAAAIGAVELPFTCTAGLPSPRGNRPRMCRRHQSAAAGRRPWSCPTTTSH